MPNFSCSHSLTTSSARRRLTDATPGRRTNCACTNAPKPRGPRSSELGRLLHERFGNEVSPYLYGAQYGIRHWIESVQHLSAVRPLSRCTSRGAYVCRCFRFLALCNELQLPGTWRWRKETTPRATDRAPPRSTQALPRPITARGSRFALILVDRERVGSRLFVGMLCPSCGTENVARKEILQGMRNDARPGLRIVRSRARRRREVLRRMRCAGEPARGRQAAPATDAREAPASERRLVSRSVRRPRRLHIAVRVARRGGGSRTSLPLLRHVQTSDRALRGNRGEVHRGCRDGSVGHAGGDRGRRGARGAGGARARRGGVERSARKWAPRAFARERGC